MGQFWPPLPKPIHGGTVAVPALASGAVSAAIPITFSGFGVAPRVVPVPGTVRLTCSVSNVTATGADLFAANWSPAGAGASIINWVAIEA